MVSYQKGPTRHAYAWQIGPFWQDTLEYGGLLIEFSQGLDGPRSIFKIFLSFWDMAGVSTAPRPNRLPNFKVLGAIIQWRHNARLGLKSPAQIKENIKSTR